MHCSKNFRKFPIAIILSFSSVAFAEPQSVQTDVTQFLNDFHNNPKKVMDTIPKKITSTGEIISENQFSDKAKESKDYITKKDKIREKLMKSAYKNTRRFSPFAEYLGNDNPKYLVDTPSAFIDNIDLIDTKNIATYRLPYQPWSGSYWPLSQGSVTNRYSEHLNITDVNIYADYILNKKPPRLLISEGRTNNLSPAEKYDLLLSDSNFSLTNTILNEVRSYGTFEGWEGICHGWAPAAYMYNRPTRSVKLANAGGLEITFYPSDIKALSSLLWANLSYPTKFIGGRCNQKNPQQDPTNGRILSQECFDTNPATFHLSLINQMALNSKSFVFDATYDFQVWNQPILGYKYIYFNPQTGKTSNSYKDVALTTQQFTNDKFKKYRSTRAAKVVGVEARIEYIAETGPSAATRDSSAQDNVVAVIYYYDLELDASGRIIGGEWYQNAHPDFVWTPTAAADVTTNLVPGSTNETYFYNTYKWQENPTRPFKEWTAYSPYAAQMKVPLENIVRSLVAWSSDDRAGPIPENCQQPCIPSTYKWHRY